MWKPPIEVCQRDDRLVIEAAAAGIEPGQLQIEATPETILLKAEVSHAHPADKGTVHVCEFQPGHLFRLVQLPVKIDPDVVKAEFHNGLVRITATTAKEQRARTVKVQAV